MNKALTFSFELDSTTWLSRPDLRECGFLRFGRGGTHRLAERLLVSSKVLNSRASLLNPAAKAPHSSVGPQFWLLWLGLTSGTEKQQGTAFYPPLTDQVRVELGIKNHNKKYPGLYP